MGPVRKLIVMAVIAGAAAAFVAGAPAKAQVPTQPVISFDLRNSPIEDVLGALQELVPGFRFVKKPEVKGKVTARMENADVRTALQKICEEANATFKLDQGTYIIEAKAEAGPRGRARTPTTGVPVSGPTPGAGGPRGPTTGPRLPGAGGPAGPTTGPRLPRGLPGGR